MGWLARRTWRFWIVVAGVFPLLYVLSVPVALWIAVEASKRPSGSFDDWVIKVAISYIEPVVLIMKYSLPPFSDCIEWYIGLFP